MPISPPCSSASRAPNEESLKETKKLQNLRKGGSLAEKVRRIQDRGMEVWAGMIVGFDNDDENIFSAQEHFLREARISTAWSACCRPFRGHRSLTV